MSDYGTPPPPPPPPMGGYSAPMGAAGGEHPEGQKLFIMSIVGLLCCAPLNIYVFITANNILKAGGAGYDISKIKTAKTIAIVGLVLWVVGVIFNLAFGGLAALSGSSTSM